MKALLTALLLTGVAGTALADDKREIYGGVFVGLSQADDATAAGANAAGAPRTINLSYDDATLFGVNAGVAGAEQSWGRLRAEIELAFRENDVDQLIFNGNNPGFRPGSHTSLTTSFLNAYWDSPLINDRFRIGGGAGFGVAAIDQEIFYTGAAPFALSNSEVTQAYQLIGQGEWRLNDQFSLIGDVRYLDTGDFSVERVNLSSGALESILDSDWTSTETSIGLRYRF